MAARACVDAGFRPRIVQEITDPFMILTLVAAGVGVALMTAEGRRIMPSAGGVRAAARRPDLHETRASPGRPTTRRPVLKAVLDVAEEVLPTPSEN